VLKKFVNGTTIRAVILMAIACIFSTSFSVMAEAPAPPAADSACGKPAADEAQNYALLTKLMLEPHKFNSLADLIKSLPAEAMAKMTAMQKSTMERQSTDWPNLCRYAGENAQVKASGIRPRVIFLGDSITENWKLGDPELFGPTVLDRGIGGQTTPQILLRFYQDVVALHPRVVHIMAGVNDIMGNTGATSDATIIYNIRAMIDIAKANGIRVVLASVTPSKTFVARPNVNLAPRIASIDRLLEKLAAAQHITFVNYVPSLSDQDNGLVAALSNDGLHPNRDGYAAMRPLALNAISRAGK
jgi:lysophospholipase L1-like esterase